METTLHFDSYEECYDWCYNWIHFDNYWSSSEAFDKKRAEVTADWVMTLYNGSIDEDLITDILKHDDEWVKYDYLNDEEEDEDE